jgi:hypothetical protein
LVGDVEPPPPGLASETSRRSRLLDDSELKRPGPVIFDYRALDDVTDVIEAPTAFANVGRAGDDGVVLTEPSLSTSGETLTIEESVTLRARTETAGHAGDEHEWSWGSG